MRHSQKIIIFQNKMYLLIKLTAIYTKWGINIDNI